MSNDKIGNVKITLHHMECMRCGKEIDEAFAVYIRPKTSLDGDQKKIRGMCAWAADLEFCDNCMSHILHEMMAPDKSLLDGMITMDMGPEEMK